MEAVVGLEDERTLAVAPLDLVAQHVQHHAAQTGIDAVDPPAAVGEIVGIAEGDATQRVRDREHDCRECRRLERVVAPVLAGSGPLRATALDRAPQGIDRRCSTA